MTLRFSPQFVSIIAFLKGKDTTPEMYARLHGIQIGSVWDCLGWHRAKYDNAGAYRGRYNSLMANPRLRQWLKREQDYSDAERKADRDRRILLDAPKGAVSRSKRLPPANQRTLISRAKKSPSGTKPA